MLYVERHIEITGVLQCFMYYDTNIHGGQLSVACFVEVKVLLLWKK